MSTPDSFDNPIDGRRYVAPDGWNVYRRSSDTPDEDARPVRIVQTRLLTSEDEIAARTTTAEIISFMREAKRLADEILGKSDVPFRLLVQFQCTSRGHTVAMAKKGEPSEKSLLQYQTAIETMSTLKVRLGEIVFQFELAVRE